MPKRLSFFMVNMSHYFLKKGTLDQTPKSILDLKAICRGDKYVRSYHKTPSGKTGTSFIG